MSYTVDENNNWQPLPITNLNIDADAIIKQNAQLDSSIEQSNTEQNNTRQSNSETPKIDAGSQCNVDTNTAVGLKRDSEPQKGSGVDIEIKAQSKIEQEDLCNTMIAGLHIIANPQKIEFFKFSMMSAHPTPSQHILISLYNKGFSLWMNIHGEICFKTIHLNKIQKISHTKLQRLLCNLFKRDIYVFTRDAHHQNFLNSINRMEKQYKTDKAMLEKYGDKYPNIIKEKIQKAEQIVMFEGIRCCKLYEPLMSVLRTTDLCVVSDDKVFEPFVSWDYVLKGNIYYKNAYVPSSYTNNPNRNLNLSNSITLQFLFYLSGYREDKFRYIINWLALLVNSISTHYSNSISHTLLILIGDKKSGKDILYKNIIEPIIGEKFCLDMDEKILGSEKVEERLENKLFLNVSNIRMQQFKYSKCKDLLYNILHEYNFIKNPHLQKMLMLESNKFMFEPQCLYNVFTVPGDLEKDFYAINQDGVKQYYRKNELVSLIYYDLNNFVSWLNTQGNVIANYDLSKTIKDQELVFDKPQTEWEILVEFVDYITSNDLPTLLKENIDFTDKDKTKEIEQMEHLYNKDCRVNKRYIRKLFFKLYYRKKNLYAELEKFNPELFKNAKGYDGKPCFMIPKYS